MVESSCLSHLNLTLHRSKFVSLTVISGHNVKVLKRLWSAFGCVFLDADENGIPKSGSDQSFDFLGLGSGKEACSTLARQIAEDCVDRGLKTQIEKSVSFVEY